MGNKKINWEFAVSSTSSTTDIVITQPSGNYGVSFITDKSHNEDTSKGTKKSHKKVKSSSL
jgi:hypothetical protein